MPKTLLWLWRWNFQEMPSSHVDISFHMYKSTIKTARKLFINGFIGFCCVTKPKLVQSTVYVRCRIALDRILKMRHKLWKILTINCEWRMQIIFIFELQVTQLSTFDLIFFSYLWNREFLSAHIVSCWCSVFFLLKICLTLPGFMFVVLTTTRCRLTVSLPFGTSFKSLFAVRILVINSLLFWINAKPA